MKISVIGAGAIGNLVAGYLKLNQEEVSLVGRRDSISAINKDGLNISGVRGDFNINIKLDKRLKASPDLAILTTKTQDIQEAIKNNLEFLKGAVVLTTQNGVQADNIVSRFLHSENIISSIIMFGATYLKPAKVMHNFEGKWIIGKIFGPNDNSLERIQNSLSKVFPVVISDNIKGMKYLKLFVNANNCIAAILGLSMQEAFSDIQICRRAITIWKEALEVVKKSGINLVSLPDFPIERIEKLTSLSLNEAAGIFSNIMRNLSKEPVYGSILQSIKRDRPSEIDYINGEFVNLAKENNLNAPLNEKLVEMVHGIEKQKKFFTNEELISATEKFIG